MTLHQVNFVVSESPKKGRKLTTHDKSRQDGITHQGDQS
jgi:hypothetical protein